MSKFAALVVAGGSGSRMLNATLPKQYLKVRGKTILEYTIERLLAHPQIRHVQLVVDFNHEEYYLPVLRNLGRSTISLSEAGAARTDSVFSGLKGLLCVQPDYVLIHDAARPLISPKVIDAVISALLQGCEGVVPVVSVHDTVVERKADSISKCVDRKNLAAVQTPQGFDFKKILNAYNSHFEKPYESYTDDARIALAHGMEVRCVLGDRENFKITDPYDFKFADFLLSQVHY